ncbi:MAG: DUF5615 family PIN-like protein [Acidimicrobiales bacterium]
MKLLLDEMFPAAIAEALRAGAHEVLAVQEEPTLRGLSDADVFAVAQRMERAVLTENAREYLPLVADTHARGEAHWGLILTTNRSFPRHRTRFIGAMTRALASLLEAHRRTGAVSLVVWLRPDPHADD